MASLSFQAFRGALGLWKCPQMSRGKSHTTKLGRAGSAKKKNAHGKGPGESGPSSTRRVDNPFRSLDRNLESRNPYKEELKQSRPETLMQAQMYTPEMLQTENLTLNCFRLVAYGLHMPEILDRYAARATELAPRLRPSDFSKILTAFARAEHRHEGMIKAFTRYIPARLPQFLPMDLSQTCNAYAKLREHDEGLFRRVSSEMPHKLPLFEPWQLKNVANAYARLRIRDDLLFDDIADEVLRRPQDFSAVDLYLLANAFSSFRIRHPRLWLTLADWLLQTYLDLGAVEIAVLLNAMSTVGFHHDALLETLLISLSQEPLISSLEAGSLTLALNALARLQWSGLAELDGAMEPLADRAVVLLKDLDPPGITRLLHACTRIEALAEHEKLVDSVLKHAKTQVAEFNAQSLSLLAHCCSVLKKRDAALLTQVAKAIPNRISDFTPQALAMTAQAFAKLEIRSEILFYLLAAEACEKMPLFTGQGMAMLLRAFGQLQVKNERLVQACRKQVRALSQELMLSEIEDVEDGFRALGSLDASTEAILRRQRRHLQASEAAVDAQTDPWASEEHRLLDRLAEKPSSVVPIMSWPAQQPEPEEDLPEETMHSDVPERSAEEPLDVWELWGKDGVSGEEEKKLAPGSGAGDATPSGRLREYLARPERTGTGRRPLVLGRDFHESQPQSRPAERMDVDEDTGERKRGRKSRR